MAGSKPFTVSFDVTAHDPRDWSGEAVAEPSASAPALIESIAKFKLQYSIVNKAAPQSVVLTKEELSSLLSCPSVSVFVTRDTDGSFFVLGMEVIIEDERKA